MATERPIQLGMAGLGRMGANIARRLVRDGHACVVFDLSPRAVQLLETKGATGAHCAPNGAGHFVKMVHNGIECGMMASLAEGLNVLLNANAGTRQHVADAETAPMGDSELHQFDIDTAAALADSPTLEAFGWHVSDSGEGRWTSIAAIAAIEEGMPTPVLTTALYSHCDSRGVDTFANTMLSALRKQFGGHDERTT